MHTSIIEDLNILRKYNLSPNELFIIRLFLIYQDEDDDSLLRQYLSIPEYDRGSLYDILVSLQKKRIILKDCKIPKPGEEFDPLDIEFNKTFVKGFYKASFDLGNELREAYPMFGNINGNPTPLRGVTKKFNSLEDCYRAYGKAINWNPEKHKEIVELVNWAKNYTNFIQFSLASFVVDRHWETLQALKDGEISNINFDTIKDL